MTFLSVNVDGLSPNLSLGEVLTRDLNDVYSGNANLTEWLRNRSDVVGNAESRTQLDILALPLGFLVGGALASAFTRTTTTTTTTTTALPILVPEALEVSSGGISSAGLEISGDGGGGPSIVVSPDGGGISISETLVEIPDGQIPSGTNPTPPTGNNTVQAHTLCECLRGEIWTPYG